MAFRICLACETGRINFSFKRSHPCGPDVAPKLVNLVLFSGVYVGLTLREVMKTKGGVWVLALFALLSVKALPWAISVVSGWCPLQWITTTIGDR
jgi:hypothetical protein